MAQRAPGAGGGSASVTSTGRLIGTKPEPGIYLPIIDFVRSNLPGFVNAAVGRSGSRMFDVPVGIGGPAVSPPRVVLSPVVQQPGGLAQTPLPPEIDRRDSSQNQGVVQLRTRLSDFLRLGVLTNNQYIRMTRGETGTPAEIAALNEKVVQQEALKGLKPAVSAAPPAKVISDPVVKPPPQVVKSTTTTGGSMDLGSIITDLGTAYIQTKYAPNPGFSGPVQTQPAYTVLDAGSDIIDYFTNPATGTVTPVVKKKPCRRRRRRRLATKSDLGDLAALKAILGNGEAFKAWIATHSR